MTDSEQTSNNAALNLQDVIEEERSKRIDAENYAKALVEEFTNCSDFEEVRTKFRDRIKEFAPAALINIVTLANGAESESVRANLNKWILDWAMSDKIDGSANDLANLLNALQKNDEKPQATGATQLTSETIKHITE